MSTNVKTKNQYNIQIIILYKYNYFNLNTRISFHMFHSKNKEFNMINKNDRQNKLEQIFTKSKLTDRNIGQIYFGELCLSSVPKIVILKLDKLNDFVESLTGRFV